MRPLLILLAVLSFPVMETANAQVNQVPAAGKWIRATEPQLGFDCPMVLDHSSRLQCATQVLSVSRVAGEFSLASTATLSCATAQCFLTFPAVSSATAYADWIMPSAAVTVESILLSWDTAVAAGTTRWYADWCAYGLGQQPCSPDGSNLATFASSTGGSGARTDLAISPWPWSRTWGVDQHVVLSIRRDGYSPTSGDTVNGDVLLESLRIEMTRD